jgi:hypothetical protein
MGSNKLADFRGNRMKPVDSILKNLKIIFLKNKKPGCKLKKSNIDRFIIFHSKFEL